MVALAQDGGDGDGGGGWDGGDGGDGYQDDCDPTIECCNGDGICNQYDESPEECPVNKKANSNSNGPGSSSFYNNVTSSSGPNSGGGGGGSSGSSSCPSCPYSNKAGGSPGVSLGNTDLGQPVGRLVFDVARLASGDNMSPADFQLQLADPSMASQVIDITGTNGIRTITVGGTIFTIFVIDDHGPQLNRLRVDVKRSLSSTSFYTYAISRTTLEGVPATSMEDIDDSTIPEAVFSSSTTVLPDGSKIVVSDSKQDKNVYHVIEQITATTSLKTTQIKKLTTSGAYAVISTVSESYKLLADKWIILSRVKEGSAGVNLSTSWTYNENPNSEHFGKVIAEDRSDGSWTRMEYHPGQDSLSRVVKPYLDTPAPAAGANPYLGTVVTEYAVMEYPDEVDGLFKVLITREIVNGVELKKVESTTYTQVQADGSRIRTKSESTRVFHGSYPDYGIEAQTRTSYQSLYQSAEVYNASIGTNWLPKWQVVMELKEDGTRYDYTQTEGFYGFVYENSTTPAQNISAAVTIQVVKKG
jgi:hypothetical protein